MAHGLSGTPLVREPTFDSVPIGVLQELIMLPSPLGCYKFQLVKSSATPCDDFLPEESHSVLSSENRHLKTHQIKFVSIRL